MFILCNADLGTYADMAGRNHEDLQMLADL